MHTHTHTHATRAASAMAMTTLPLLLALALALALALLAPAAAAGAGVSVRGHDSAAAAIGPSAYIVLIDAGSTGSRAHVHEYRVEKSRPLPLIDESKNKKIKPGLSSYASDPSAASQSIQELLEFIKETVPKEHWATTPLHLQATAGLRSVTPDEASAVLDVVRDDLERSGFLFERSWARVISGEQEGINGWMAVNYLLGVFDEAHKHEAARARGLPVPAASPAASTGVVEMGGSSMQITFAPSSPSPEDRKQLTEVRVAGVSYWLYTHSFLQYGLQAAEKLFQRLAIQEIEEAGNPCYPPSFRHSSKGDFERCTTLLAGVVDKSAKCALHSCSFNGVYQPRIQNEQFLAIENFYYTAKFFGTAEEQDQTAPSDSNAKNAAAVGNQFISGLRAKGREFCNKDWSHLRELYPSTPTDELKAFCFSAAYQSVVLESGLGFGQGSNLRVAKTIKGKGIDWEMGAAILELMPKDPKEVAAAAAAAAKAKRGGNAGAIAIDDFVYAQPTRARPLPTGSSAAHPAFCKQCIAYTMLFALAVVLAYFGWTRYWKRTSGPVLTSYSQSAFNRV